LFLKDDLSFLGSQFLFAVGAGDIAERHRLGDGAEFPKRTLALGVGVGRRRAADQRLLSSHFVHGSALRVVWKLKDLHLVLQHRSRLSEGRCCTENEQDEDSDFHGVCT